MLFVKVRMLMLLSLYLYLFYWLVIDNSDSLNHSLWCLVNTSLLSRVGGKQMERHWYQQYCLPFLIKLSL